MKRLALGLAAVALLLFLAPSAAVLAVPGDPGHLAPDGDKKDGDKKDGDDGGSKFDEPKEEQPEFPEEPVPGSFAFKDFRMEMEADDTRFWKELPITDESKKAGVILLMQMKLPKSNDIFDVQFMCQGWEHKGTFDFDGRKVGASNYKALADIFYERDMKEWKDVRDEEKPRARRLSREISKAYRYALTAQHPTAGIPLRKEMWLFKFKDKTYGLQVLYTTTSAKNELITDQVGDILQTLREWKDRKK